MKSEPTNCTHCGSKFRGDPVEADGGWYCGRPCAIANLAMTGSICSLGRHIVNVVVVEPAPGVSPATIVLACPACDTAWEVKDSTFWKAQAVKLEIDQKVLATLREGGR